MLQKEKDHKIVRMQEPKGSAVGYVAEDLTCVTFDAHGQGYFFYSMVPQGIQLVSVMARKV